MSWAGKVSDSTELTTQLVLIRGKILWLEIKQMPHPTLFNLQHAQGARTHFVPTQLNLPALRGTM